MLKRTFSPFSSPRVNQCFFLWVFFVVILTSVPYFFALRLAGAQTVYNWLLPPYPEDGLAYVAWVKQAALGGLLLKMKFTSIAHGGFLFHPLFLVTGWFAALLGMEGGLALFIARLASIVFFLYVFGHFVVYLQLNKRQTVLSLFFLCFSSGLGWILQGGQSTDLWMPGINTLWSLVWVPVFPFSYALIILTILWFSLAMEVANKQKADFFALGAGGSFGMLAFVHPYDIVFVSVVLFGLSALKLKNPGVVLRFLLIAAPPVIIQLVLSKVHPVLSAHSNAEMLSPLPQYYATGLGIPGLLALVGCCLVLIKKELRKKLSGVLFWFSAAWVLAYAPIWFQAKMMGGVHIPVCILAAVGLDKLLKIIPWPRKWIESAVLILLLMSTTPTHFKNFQLTMQELAAEKEYYYRPVYLEQAFEFIERDSSPADVVLADLQVSGHIPGRTGNTVLYGHWAQSIDADNKMMWLGKFMFQAGTASEENRRKELQEKGIKYILVEPNLLYSFGKNNVEKLFKLGEVVFANSQVKVVRLGE